MLTKKGNIFLQSDAEAVVLPISCYISPHKTDTPLTALNSPLQKHAVLRWKDLPRIIGSMLYDEGGIVKVVMSKGEISYPVNSSFDLIAFPTRPGKVYVSEVSLKNILPEYTDEYQKAKRWIPGYMSKTLLQIIEAGLPELVELTNTRGWKKVYIPRFGINRSGIEWEVTRKLLDTYLDDRFISLEYRSQKDD